MGQPTAELDGFKTRKLYPDAKVKRSFEVDWVTGGRRKLEGTTREGEFVLRGRDPVLLIDGAGVGQLSGPAPRMYFYDKPELLKWKDVEVTFYGRRMEDTTGGRGAPGFVAGVRSEHQNNNTTQPCRCCAYYGRMLYDGRVDFEKELAHVEDEHGDITGYTDDLQPEIRVKWKAADGTMIDTIPRDVWIGYKFVVWNSPENSIVNFELYRDETDGQDGGDWKLVRSHQDTGDWPVQNLQHCPGSPTRQLLCPSTSVFIRNDKLGRCDYKKISIREIAHP